MTGLIILAAGQSSRLGLPKQTLLYKGKTLLELAIEAGLNSKCQPVVVVSGAYAEAVENSIKLYNVTIVHNPDWAKGMASSTKAGIIKVQEMDNIDSVVIILCDQPFVTRATIDSLLYKRQATGKKIIASAYNDIIGVPVLFDRSLFGELQQLQDHEGAKQILKTHPNEIATIPFEKGSIDIDTLTDYENLIKNT